MNRQYKMKKVVHDVSLRFDGTQYMTEENVLKILMEFMI